MKNYIDPQFDPNSSECPYGDWMKVGLWRCYGTPNRNSTNQPRQSEEHHQAEPLKEQPPTPYFSLRGTSKVPQLIGPTESRHEKNIQTVLDLPHELHEIKGTSSKDLTHNIHVTDIKEFAGTLGEFDEENPCHALPDHDLPHTTTIDAPLYPTKQTKWNRVLRPQGPIMIEEKIVTNRVGQKREHPNTMVGLAQDGEPNRKKFKSQEVHTSTSALTAAATIQPRRAQ